MSLSLKRFLLIGIVMLITESAFSQLAQIHGRIIDAKTLDPLPFVNVFINNTTIGTSSDENGNFVLKNVPLGDHEIIYSFVGYQSFQNRIVVKVDNTQQPAIKLIPLDQKLDEVEVVSERDKTWEKQLRRFERIFIGEGIVSDCKIKNPWVIEFAESPNLLSAHASQPIEIENAYLGYRLFFYLKNFQSTSTTYSIVGDVRFEEIVTTNEVQAVQWMKNREKVYLSSIRHLTKSILDGTARKEGYELYAEKKKDKPKSTNFAYEKAHNLMPYDTNGIVSKVNENNFRILLKDKIEVHNNLEISKSIFYTDDSHEISWIEAKDDFVLVNREGALLNPKEVMISGDMTSGRVASMLPLNYIKGELIKIESGNRVLAGRLQEKIYLRTDKPYYYAGEDIWISGFVNYRSPASKDTLSKVLYVDLIDENQSTIHSLILKIDSARVMGSVRIPDKLKPGNYALRSYTSWLRNYGNDALFYKPIPVLDVYEKVNVNEVDVVNNVEFEIITNKQEYKRREIVNVKFQLADDDRSLKATFSVSVLDLSQVNQIKEELNIVNSYSLPDELPIHLLSRFQFPIERGMKMQGIYLNPRNRPVKSKQVTIVRGDWSDIRQVTTNDKGEFVVPDLIFYDSMKFGVQVNGSVKWILPEGNSERLTELPHYKDLSIVKTQTPQHKINYESDQGVILLNAVEVMSGKISKGNSYEASYGKPDWSLKGDNLEQLNPNLASAIQSKLAGYYQLINKDTHWFLKWSRGNGEPALFIDNVQFFNSGETVGDRLYSISTSMVDHVEVSSMASSQLGANGAFGAIYVFMKKTDEVSFRSLSVIRLRGFDSPHVFQFPAYENESENNSTQDNRSTLYWNPKLNLSSSGVTEFNFYTSDMVGNYKIIIEGVTQKGIPFRNEKLITVID